MNLIPQRSEYERAFETEREQVYPNIDDWERLTSAFVLERSRLEAAARVLACPVKANPPNWQHGRLLYSLARQYFSCRGFATPVLLIDIGTAKGFSALCLEWARRDSGVQGLVISVDVIDPKSHARRNTVAECDGGLKTLAEILAPWPEAESITFQHGTGIELLEASADRVHIAFVDGKHSRDVVQREGRLLAARQLTGDVAMFDDVQIPGVAKAVESLSDVYDLNDIEPSHLVNRKYVIGIRR